MKHLHKVIVKHWKAVTTHVRKHHKKYVSGAFAWFAVVKMILFLIWLFSMHTGNIFAQSMDTELQVVDDYEIQEPYEIWEENIEEPEFEEFIEEYYNLEEEPINIPLEDIHKCSEDMYLWYENRFIDGAFWEQNPSSQNVACVLYGPDSVYVRWNYDEFLEECHGSDGIFELSVINNIPDILNSNSIYIINNKFSTIDSIINIPKCTAIISKSSWWTNIFTNQDIDWFVNFDNVQYSIFDNFYMWYNKNNNYTYTYTFPYWIKFENASNNTLNQVKIYNMENWLFINWDSVYNVFNNMQLFNNKENWIFMENNCKNSFNNMQIYNNGNWFISDGCEWEGNGFVLNNSMIYNNEKIWLKLVNNSYLYDVYSYNNEQNRDIDYDDIYINTVFMTTEHKIHITSGWKEKDDLESIEADIDINWDYIANPLYGLNWNDFLHKWNNDWNVSKIITWYNNNVNPPDFYWNISYWSGILTQKDAIFEVNPDNGEIIKT